MTQAERTHESSARDQLLDVAERHFAARGFAGVTIKDIAQDLGIRQPSIYYHVPGGKEDLYREVMIRHMERHREGVEAALAAASDSLESQLIGVGLWMLSRPPLDNAQMVKRDFPELSPEVVKQMETCFERCVFAPMERVFLRANESGLLRHADARVLARMFFALMQSLGASRQYWQRHTDAEHVVGSSIDIFLHGILRN